MGLFASSADVLPAAGFEVRTPGEVSGEGVEHDTRGASAHMLAVLVNDAEAVYPVRIDPTFSDENWISMGGIPGANSLVRAPVVDGSGNLYIGGDFIVVGNVIANYVAGWNGSSWSALGSGIMDSALFEPLIHAN